MLVRVAVGVAVPLAVGDAEAVAVVELVGVALGAAVPLGMAVDELLAVGVAVVEEDAVGVGVAVEVEVMVGVDVQVAVGVAVRVDDAVGVDDAVAVDVPVREGDGVGVAVDGARSTRPNSPNEEIYAHWVPCPASRLSRTWPGRTDQVELLRWSTTSRLGSAYAAA